MNQLGGWLRPETGWRLTAVSFEYSVLCCLLLVHTGQESSSFMESEPVRDAGAAPKADGRTNVAVQVRRSPR
jgi:hypothetical protein